MSPLTVVLPTGTSFEVLSEEEEDYLRHLIEQYHQQFMLESIADQAELDRLVCMELQVHRYNRWAGRGTNDTGNAVDQLYLSKMVRDLSTEIRMTKKQLGIDRITRERERGTGSVFEFIRDLLKYAKEFGLHREEQLDLALELMNQLFTMAILYKQSDDEERRDMGYTAEEILVWLTDQAYPEYLALDEHFRLNTAKYYVVDVINVE